MADEAAQLPCGTQSDAAAAEDYVLRSGVRSGLKREFAFAIKAQSELSPMGRTRSGKIRRSSSFQDPPSSTPGNRKVKRSGTDGEIRETPAAPPLDEVSPVVLEKPVVGDDEKVGASGPEVVGDPVVIEEEPALETAIVVDGPDEMKKEISVEEAPALETAMAVDSRDEMEKETSGLEAPALEMVMAVDCRDVTKKEISALEPPALETAILVDCWDEVKKDLSVVEAPVLETAIVVDVQDEMKKELSVVEAPVLETVIVVDVQDEMKEEVPVQKTCALETAKENDGRDEMKVDESVVIVEPEKPIRRFTRSIFKSKGEASPPGRSSSVTPVAEGSAVEAPIVIGRLDDLRPPCEPEIVVPSVSIKDGLALETAIVVDGNLDGSKVDMHTISQKHVRRFTRSLLKSTVEESPPPMDVSSTVTTSGGSDGEEAKGGEANTANGASGPVRTTPKKKMELKMSKKIALTKLPTNVRELLATGLLDGLTVKYISSGKKQGMISGVIKDGSIVCSCSSCRGTNAISAYQFELHAGSTKKHPSDFIYLENGSNIRDVLKACTSAPLDMLESTIQSAISSGTNNQSSRCQQCNESFQASRIGKLSSICDSCLVERLSPIHQGSTPASVKSARPLKSLLALDSSDCSSKNISSQKKSVGRMTTKDLWLHKLVFMNDTLPDGTEVAYYARGQRLLEGYIKGSGIFCSCCNSVVSPSQFEAHAGWAKRRKPYLNIYTSNGVSLHELSVSLSKGRKFSGRENDDLCRICADGGDLLLCDLCPRAFHKECIGLSIIPKGDWYCPCCQAMHEREKYVEHNNNAIAAGRVSGVDPIEQIFQRCIRIVQTPDMDASSCVLCKCHDFSKSGFGPRTVLLCDQCEKEFHIGCLKDHNMADLKELPEGKWFCCSECSTIHSALQKFLLSGSQHLSDLHLDIIKRKRMEKGLSDETDLDIKWRLLNGKIASPDSRLLLSKAISIFHETFAPIIDISNGQDFIPAMVYGREIRDQDFGGMYCAVLTVNSAVVSAGILRVLGCDAAELPLVATTMESQGYGYFQSLFACVETLLESLNVKNLVLPATKEAEAIWVKKFGFCEITQNQLEEYTKGSRTMNFQGTPMLHKQVSKSRRTSEEQTE